MLWFFRSWKRKAGVAMTGVMDYGIGNIGSILNMIRKVGAQGVPVRTAEELSRCSRLILPGVGRFDAGMALLE